jgi:hypothetical protein
LVAEPTPENAGPAKQTPVVLAEADAELPESHGCMARTT